MLKLERASHSSGFILRLREKEPFFEPQLLKALAIAFILHLGGLLIFHISPFKPSSAFIFPPIQVQVDHSIQATSTFAIPLVKEEESLSPPPLSLVAPPLTWISSPQSMLIPVVDLDLNPFEHLEGRVWPLWEPPFPLILEEAAIQLSISGDLAEHSLIVTHPLLNVKQPLSFLTTSPIYVSYHVQMDERTGELFWYERTSSSGNSSIDRMTEKIILHLRFAINDLKKIIHGDLHFAVLSSSIPEIHKND